ncbi:MAG: LysE family translocator [Hyphomicrobiales bacterium]
MSIETWLAFALAATIVIVIPGPTVMLVIGYALGRGRSAIWSTVPGVVLGDFTAMTASLVGLGALLSASATLFTVLKWVGAIYLIWLGVTLWRSKPEGLTPEEPAGERGRWAMFVNCYAVTALNPKTILFFVAFLPQFIDHSAPVVPQFTIMEITFLVLAALNISIYTTAAATLRALTAKPSALKVANRIGGSLLIGAGTLVAATARN